MQNQLIKQVADGAPGVMLVVSAADLKQVVGAMCQKQEVKIAEALSAQKERPALSRREVSTMLGVDLSTLWRWDKMGYLKPVKIGSKVMYRASDIERMLTERNGAV